MDLASGHTAAVSKILFALGFASALILVSFLFTAKVKTGINDNLLLVSHLLGFFLSFLFAAKAKNGINECFR